MQRTWCWEGLGAGGKGDIRGWDGWMASPIRWTWVWVNSGSWWWMGRPGVLQFMGSQRVGHDWATDWLNWTDHIKSLGIYSNIQGLSLVWTQNTRSIFKEKTNLKYLNLIRGDNIQLWHTPFPILNQCVVPYLFLTVASWSEYRFLRRRVRWFDIPISWRVFHSLLWIIQSKALV